MVKVDKAKLGPSTARKSVAGYAKKPVVYSKRKKKGISDAHQSKHRDEGNVHLIARMTRKKAAAFLEAHQVLAKKDEIFQCGQCGAVMVLEGQKVDVLPCSSSHRECHRPRLHDPRHACEMPRKIGFLISLARLCHVFALPAAMTVPAPKLSRRGARTSSFVSVPMPLPFLLMAVRSANATHFLLTMPLKNQPATLVLFHTWIAVALLFAAHPTRIHSVIALRNV